MNPISHECTSRFLDNKIKLVSQETCQVYYALIRIRSSEVDREELNEFSVFLTSYINISFVYTLSIYSWGGGVPERTNDHLKTMKFFLW